MRYKRFLTPTLAEALERERQAPAADQLSVLPELALMREGCGQAVALFGVALEHGDTDSKLQAASVMQSALERVVKVAEQASRISANTSTKFSIHHLHSVIAQITQAAYKTFGAGADVEAFAKACREIAVPVTETRNIDPSQEVAELESSIPECAGDN